MTIEQIQTNEVKPQSREQAIKAAVFPFVFLFILGLICYLLAKQFFGQTMAIVAVGIFACAILIWYNKDIIKFIKDMKAKVKP